MLQRGFARQAWLAYAVIVAGAWALAEALLPHGWSGWAWFALAPLAALVRRPMHRYLDYACAYGAGCLFHLRALDWVRTSYAHEGYFTSWALWWITLGGLLALLWPTALVIARQLALAPVLPLALVWPAAWGLAEWLRDAIFTASLGQPYPLVHLGITQVDRSGLAPAVQLGGGEMVVAVLMFANGALADLATVSSRRALGNLMVAPAAFGLAVWAMGAVAYPLPQPLTGTALVALIHTDTVYQLVATRHRALAHQLGLPLAPKPWLAPDWFQAANPPLILTTERALPGLVEVPLASASRTSPPLVGRTSIPDYNPWPALCQFAQCHRATLMLGLTRRLARPNAASANALVGISPAGEIGPIYDKAFLVLGTEQDYPLLRRLGRLPEVPFTPGTQWPRFVCDGRGKRPLSVAPLICYDVCFSRPFDAQTNSQRSDHAEPVSFWIASGDETADDTGQLADRMLRFTRLRSMEYQRAIVRAVAGGYCGVAWPDGRWSPAAEPLASKPALCQVPSFDESPVGRPRRWLSLAFCCAIALAALLARWQGR